MADISLNMATCRFVGKIASAVMDTSDVGDRPDSIGISGLRATITAEVPGRMVRNAATGTIYVLDDFYMESDAAGVLRNPLTGEPFIDVVASNDVDLNPTNWTYHVRIHVPSIREIAAFSVSAPSGMTINLASVIPVAPSPGTTLVDLQNAIAQMNAIRDDIINNGGSGGGDASAVWNMLNGGATDLSALTTVEKSHLVAALNEVDADATLARTLLNGSASNLAALNTASKVSLVTAINEVNTLALAIRTMATAGAANLNALTTTTKTSLVAAINELDAALATAGDAVIVDGSTSTASTWSSQRITDAITASRTAILNGAPGALDTLEELANALGDDENFATTMTNALANRVRIDTAAQGLTATQQSNARTNIQAASAAQGAKADTAVQPATMNTALASKLGSPNSSATGVAIYPSMAALPATGQVGVLYIVPAAP